MSIEQRVNGLDIYAKNRGTAVHIEGNRVLYVWPCDCTKEERLTAPGRTPYSHATTAKLVRQWRADGRILPVCPNHPKWSSPQSQVERLNRQHPG